MAKNQLSANDRARLVLLVSVVVTALLYIVPYGHWIAWPLMLISTLVHELGHGVTALLVGGTFHRFEMWADGSGVAVWSGEATRLDRALVAAGGLVGPAVAAALAFTLGRTAQGARWCLLVLAASLLIAEILVVRNLFGFLFVAFLLVVCLWGARSRSDDAAQLLLIFLAVQLALSVFSRGDYLFVPTAQTARGPMPSDVGQMAQALLLPYWFWGFLCGGFSVAVLLFALRAYWR